MPSNFSFKDINLIELNKFNTLKIMINIALLSIKWKNECFLNYTIYLKDINLCFILENGKQLERNNGVV